MLGLGGLSVEYGYDFGPGGCNGGGLRMSSFGPWGPTLKERRDITELIRSASTWAGPPDRARTTPTLCHAVQGRILCDVLQDCHDHRQGRSPYPPPRVCKLATWARKRKEVHHTDTLCFCQRTGCPFQHKVAPRPPRRAPSNNGT